MANELRVFSNYQGGRLSADPGASGTTLTSAALATLPVVGTTNHMMIGLDPDGLAGAPEIVMVTAHTASATTATIVRGQEGTTGRAHAIGTDWIHGAFASDVALQTKGQAVGQLDDAAATTFNANDVLVVRCFTPKPVLINRLGMRIGTSSGNIDLAVFADAGTGLAPGTRLVTLGSTASPGTGARIFTVADTWLPTVFWLAVAVDNATIALGYTQGGGGMGAGTPLTKVTSFPIPTTIATPAAATVSPCLWAEYR